MWKGQSLKNYALIKQGLKAAECVFILSQYKNKRRPENSCRLQKISSKP